MNIVSYTSLGFNGELVDIDVDIRRGIPGVDIVGLPDGAVREARERIRIALKRSIFDFPRTRILINLAPAGVRKAGAIHDLPMAVSLLLSSGQINTQLEETIMILGELHLNGEIRPVKGVTAALLRGKELGIEYYIIPKDNGQEGSRLSLPYVAYLENINNIEKALISLKSKIQPSLKNEPVKPPEYEDFIDIKGQESLKRAMTVAAAGRHNIILFGPPGCGKTMAARRFAGILPALSPKECLEASRIWSIAGKTNLDRPLITHPMVREPHHSSTKQGLLGGGIQLQPGDVSLAHKGVLLLDETPEFGSKILQSLREPLQEGRITLSRAGERYWYPADFQLILTANPCPCGNLGRTESICICSDIDISRYWRRIGGALMDRVDMRIPVLPVSGEELLGNDGTDSRTMAKETIKASMLQRSRQKCSDQDLKEAVKANGKLGPKEIKTYCQMDKNADKIFPLIMEKFRLSSRAAHSVLKVARTIADMEESDLIQEENLLEAVSYRRYGDHDLYWTQFR